MTVQVFLIEDGKVLTTFTDDQPVVEGLGRNHFERASHIEPDPDTGRWFVKLSDSKHNGKHAGGVIARGFPTKAEAVQFEVDWINDHILDSKEWPLNHVYEA